MPVILHLGVLLAVAQARAGSRSCSCMDHVDLRAGGGADDLRGDLVAAELAGSLITLSSSTTSTAGSVTLEPTSPASLSTVRTSSTDAFSCLPPQRTIAYTENSLFLVRARRGSAGNQAIGVAYDGLA